MTTEFLPPTREVGHLAFRAHLAAMPPGAVLTTAEAAAYCAVGVSTWERMRCESKTPPAIRVTGRTLGYRKSVLDAWLTSRTEVA